MENIKYQQATMNDPSERQNKIQISCKELESLLKRKKVERESKFLVQRPKSSYNANRQLFYKWNGHRIRKSQYADKHRPHTSSNTSFLHTRPPLFSYDSTESRTPSSPQGKTNLSQSFGSPKGTKGTSPRRNKGNNKRFSREHLFELTREFREKMNYSFLDSTDTSVEGVKLHVENEVATLSTELEEVMRAMKVTCAEQGQFLETSWLYMRYLLKNTFEWASNAKNKSTDCIQTSEKRYNELYQKFKDLEESKARRERRFYRHIKHLEKHLDNQEVQISFLNQLKHNLDDAKKKIEKQEQMILDMSDKIERGGNHDNKEFEDLQVTNQEQQERLDEMDEALIVANAKIKQYESLTSVLVDANKNIMEENSANDNDLDMHCEWTRSRMTKLLNIMKMRKKLESNRHRTLMNKLRCLPSAQGVEFRQNFRKKENLQRWQLGKNDLRKLMIIDTFLLDNEYSDLQRASASKSLASLGEDGSFFFHALSRCLGLSKIQFINCANKVEVNNFDWLLNEMTFLYNARSIYNHNQSCALASRVEYLPFSNFCYLHYLSICPNKDEANIACISLLKTIEKFSKVDLRNSRASRTSITDDQQVQQVDEADIASESQLWIRIFYKFISHSLPNSGLQFFLLLKALIFDASAGHSYPILPDISLPYWLSASRARQIIYRIFPKTDMDEIRKGIIAKVTKLQTPVEREEVEMFVERFNFEQEKEFRLPCVTFMNECLKAYVKWFTNVEIENTKVFFNNDSNKDGFLSFDEAQKVYQSIDPAKSLDKLQFANFFIDGVRLQQTRPQYSMKMQSNTSDLGLEVFLEKLDGSHVYVDHLGYLLHCNGKLDVLSRIEHERLFRDIARSSLKVDRIKNTQKNTLHYGKHFKLLNRLNRALHYYTVELESRANGTRAAFAFRRYLQCIHDNQCYLQIHLERLPTNSMVEEVEANLQILNRRKEDGDSRIVKWLQKAGETPSDRMARITRLMFFVAIRCKSILRRIRERKKMNNE
eukprot:g3723.t1